MRCNVTFLVMWCYWHCHHMTPMAHSIDASSGTHTSTKGHVIPLKNYLNTTNEMVSLMAQSTSCYCHVHDQKLICSSYAIYKPHMQINSCPHMTLLCQYKCLQWTHFSQQCEQELWYTYSLHYWHMALTKHACQPVHICSTALLLESTYRPQITAHISKTKQQSATLIYHAIAIHVPTTNMPLNATYANKFMYNIKQLCQYIYLIWAQSNQQCHH